MRENQSCNFLRLYYNKCNDNKKRSDPRFKKYCHVYQTVPLSCPIERKLIPKP